MRGPAGAAPAAIAAGSRPGLRRLWRMCPAPVGPGRRLGGPGHR